MTSKYYHNGVPSNVCNKCTIGVFLERCINLQQIEPQTSSYVSNQPDSLELINAPWRAEDIRWNPNLLLHKKVVCMKNEAYLYECKKLIDYVVEQTFLCMVTAKFINRVAFEVLKSLSTPTWACVWRDGHTGGQLSVSAQTGQQSRADVGRRGKTKAYG